MWISKHKLENRIPVPYFLHDEMKLISETHDSVHRYTVFSIVREFLDRRVDRYSVTDSLKSKGKNEEWAKL